MSITGEARRQLLLLTTLYFAILFLESDVNHVPLLSAGWLTYALIPVVWLSFSLLALMAAQLWPSAATSRLLHVAMIGAALVGIIGVFPHLAANGVTWNNPGALFNPALLHGQPGPQWPLAITIGAVLGLIGGNGIAQDAAFQRAAVGWPTRIAFILVLIGVALSDSLATLGWGSSVIVVAALFLLAITLREIMAAERNAA